MIATLWPVRRKNAQRCKVTKEAPKLKAGGGEAEGADVAFATGVFTKIVRLGISSSILLQDVQLITVV